MLLFPIQFMIMIIGLLLLCGCVLGSVFKWDVPNSGLWSEGSNWDQGDTPSISSSVVIPPFSTTITLTVDVCVTVYSLNLSANAVLFFKDNSTLTITDTLLLNGGTFHTDLSSSTSFTSVNSLVLDADLVSLFSHKLIVTGLFDWKRGSIDLDGFSELVLENVTFVSLNGDQSPLNFDVLHDYQKNKNFLSQSLFLVLSDKFSLGRHHSLVLLTNGDVYTAGRNEWGQLGYADVDRNIHEKIEISNVIQIVASYYSSYALNISGSVYSWGRNNHGQLGLGDSIDRYTPISIPDLSNVKQIAGRYQTTFALTRDGKVYGWGWGDYNVLCKESTDNVLSPMLIESLQNIKFISASLTAYFITNDGSTLTCGREPAESVTYSTPTPFAEDIEFTFIEIKGSHALGIDVNQTLWSWGWNHVGQLGTGDTSDSSNPLEVVNIGKVITASGGYYSSMAVDVNNDVWFWGDYDRGHPASTSPPNDQKWIPERISELTGKCITDFILHDGSNFAYISVPFSIDLITSSSNQGLLTVNHYNVNTANLYDDGLQQLIFIYVPVFLSGSLNLTSDSLFFLSEFNLNGILAINSPMETFFDSFILGASECSTLSLESNVFVETLYWHCGTIEGVGELKVNTLVLCSSNPEPEFFSKISIGKMMTSELNVELNLTTDVVLSINGVIEIPQLSFHSAFGVSVTFDGYFKLVNTSLSLRIDSNLSSNIAIDQYSKIEILSSSSTLSSNLQLFLYYDWSNSPSGNDLSGNNNNVPEFSGTEWNPDGYYQFESNSDTLNIPNIPGKFGWQSATISLLIWFDSDRGNRFGLGTCGCGISLGDYFYYGCSGSSINVPRNQWINLVMTTFNNQAMFYINGQLVRTINSQYICETQSDFFPLGNRFFHSSSNGQWERGTHSNDAFKGLTESEITSEFVIPPSITGLGSIELKNSELTLLEYTSISFSKLIIDSSVMYLHKHVFLQKQGIYAFNESEIIIKDVASTYFDHSHINLTNSTIIHSANELNLYNLTLTNTVFKVPSVTEKLSIHALFLDSDSQIDSSIVLILNQLHWIHGEMSYLDVLEFKGLFLYGESKSWPENSLTIQNELYFNNSLDFSISHLNLITVFVTCFPGSELLLDTHSFNESLLEVENELHLTSNCSLISLLPVKSTGFVFVAGDSLLTLFKDLDTTGMIFIGCYGELELMNSTITFEGSGPYLHPDLFLYYNWVNSSNPIDLSGNHDPNAITIDGPEWKTDTTGGYLDIAPGDTLHIPNIPGEFGWKDASISMWVYWEEGGMGFEFDFLGYYSPVTYYISITKWFHLGITFQRSEVRIYADGTPIGSIIVEQPSFCYDSSIPFSLSGQGDHLFKGRVRAVQIFTKTLTMSEISLLSFDLHARIWGQGKLSLVDSEMRISPSIFGIELISLVSSIVYLDRSPPNKLNSVEVYFSELYYDGAEAELIIDSLYLRNTSSIVTNASLIVNNFYWFVGKLFSPSIQYLNRLFLYGESKIWPQNSLVIKQELYFNNSLTFSIHHLNLIIVYVTCNPGSALFLDSLSFENFSLEVKNQLHLSSNCRLNSFLPIDSTGFIAVGRESVMILNKELKSFHIIVVAYKGQIVLYNSDLTLSNARSYSDNDLFLYCNWRLSRNQIDLSGNHDSNEMIIDGPEWKTDDIGGYLDLKPGDTLFVPNIPGTQGWRDSSISLWVYLQEGGMGFGWGTWHCMFWIEPTRLVWALGATDMPFPVRKWIHLVVTTTQLEARAYVNGDYLGTHTPREPYFCSNGPPSYFHLSQVHERNRLPFRGKIRAVKVFRRTLTPSEIRDLNFNLSTANSIHGKGELSLVNSEVQLSSSKVDIRSIALISSTLHSSDVILDNLKNLELSNSSVILTHDSKILSDYITITLNASELCYDNSVDISASSVSLISINSRFQNDFDFTNFPRLDLSSSIFESASDTEISVSSFSCFDCQILGKSPLKIEFYSEINSGNFSSSLIVQESADYSSVSGQVQSPNSFDFFSHVILDDVSVSEFQSSSGSITCHSDVLMRNDVTLSSTTFTSDADIILSNANIVLGQNLELLEFQILRGSGIFFDNTSHSGKIIPLPLIIFDDNLSLSSSSTISIQINSDNSSTQVIVGSTAFLDGTIEVEFDPFKHWGGKQYVLIDSYHRLGQFTSSQKHVFFYF
ncbi:hypothetical protein GEMRC1_008205 [Eukaryota sp. GEM-RC1]